MISLKTALQIIRSGVPVTIECCSYDENRNKTGERLTLTDVTLSTLSNSSSQMPTSAEYTNSLPGNNPWHTKHLTLNFRHKNGELTKVHIPLIEKLNKNQVVL